MDLRVERLLRWARGETPGPLRIDLNPTNRCNLQCRSCWMRAYPQLDHSSQVPGERLVAIVEQGAELGVREWEITGGGEPLAESRTTMNLIRKIKALGMWGAMTTNGTLFTLDQIREMVELRWDKLVVSIDGPNPAINDYLRGMQGAFAKKRMALLEFQRWKRSYWSVTPQIQFNTVLSHANCLQLPAMIELAAEVGVELVCFEPITIHSELGKQLSLTDEDYARLPAAISLALERAQELGVWTNAGNYLEQRLVSEANQMDRIIQREGDEKPEEPLLQVTCYEPWYHLVIKTDGKVGPCCIFDSPQAQNIKSVDLREIWLGSYLENIRGALLTGKLQSFCAICNAGQVAQNRWLREQLQQTLKALEAT